MNTLNVERSYQTTWKWTMYYYYINLWAIFVVLPLCRDNCDYTVITSWMLSTCGPNEAPSRNKVVWSFTCEPNETPGRSLVTWLWVFVVLCFWKVFENYMAHMVYYVVSLFISWKVWRCIIFLNLSDYCKEDDFERTYIRISNYTLCFVTYFNINKLVFPLTPLLMLLTGH